MSVDITDDEEQVVTKAPIDTNKPSPSAAVPLFLTRAPVDIEEPPFQPFTDALSYSISNPRNASTYAVPFSVSVPVLVTRAPIDIGKRHFNLLLIHFLIVLE